MMVKILCILSQLEIFKNFQSQDKTQTENFFISFTRNTKGNASDDTREKKFTQNNRVLIKAITQLTAKDSVTGKLFLLLSSFDDLKASPAECAARKTRRKRGKAGCHRHHQHGQPSLPPKRKTADLEE